MRTITLAFLVATATAGAALAQQATERYIPIGQSPGALTMQGEISTTTEPAGAGGQTSVAMTSEAAPGGVSYVLGPQTRIYIDNSAQGRPNTMGTPADLQTGRHVEVAVASADTRTALWIKVRP